MHEKLNAREESRHTFFLLLAAHDYQWVILSYVKKLISPLFCELRFMLYCIYFDVGVVRQPRGWPLLFVSYRTGSNRELPPLANWPGL